MNFKRITSLAVSIAIMASVFLTGCGSDRESADSSATPASETASESVTLEKPKTWLTDQLTEIRIACADNLYLPKSYTLNLPVWQEVEKLTNVKVKFEVYPLKEFSETIMDTMLAAGSDLPDIIHGSSNTPTEKYHEGGLIIDLKPLLAENAPGITKLMQENPTYANSLSTLDGKVLGIKGLRATRDYGPLFIYRGEWLEKLGKSVPTTVDEFYALLKAIKDAGDLNGNGKNDEIPFGLELPYALNQVFTASFGAHVQNAWWYDENKKVYYSHTTDMNKNALMFYNKLFSEKLLDQSFVENNLDRHLQLINTDTLGVTIGWPVHIGQYNGSNPQGKWVGGPPLTGPDGKKPVIEEMNAVLNESAKVTKDAKDPALCVRWLDFLMTSEEANNLMNWGVEGTTYTVVDGKKQFTDFVTKNPDKLGALDAMRSIGAFPTLPYIERGDIAALTYTKDIVELNEKIKSEYEWAPHYPAHTWARTKDDSDEFWAKYENWYTLKDEMEMKFITGKASFDDWDKYVVKFKTFDYDRVVELQQQASDRFFAAAK